MSNIKYHVSPFPFVKVRPPGVMYNCNLIKLWISPITGYTKTGHDIEQSPLSRTFIAREFCCSDTSGAVTEVNTANCGFKLLYCCIKCQEIGNCAIAKRFSHFLYL